MVRPGGAEPSARRWRGVHELVEDRAVERPDAVALVFGDTALTYRELSCRARSFGGLLAERGVGRDSIVAIVAGRSPDLLVAILGVLHAGGAYLVADPAMPAERLARQLGDALPAVVLVEDALRSQFPDLAELGSLESELARSAHVAPGPGLPVHRDQLAYVCYTSGSTGEPKGVAVTHRGVVRLVREPDWAVFGVGDVFLQIAPVAFDASTFEIWAPLVSGGRLVIYPREPVAAERLAQVVRLGEVSVLSLTAGLFHQVNDAAPETFDGLRLLIAGGDVVSAAHVGAALSGRPGLTVVHAYGPTENTTFTTVCPVTTAAAGQTLPIGQPIRGTRVAILDADLRPVPAGTAGELCAGGDGLARGYLRRPAATAEAFVPDPSGTAPGSRLYRTGDLARWRDDGMIDFLGRADAQVKIQGYRVELGEIEARLRGDPEVRDAVLLARDAPSGDRELVAYLVLDRGVSDAAAQGARLRQWLADVFPRYMIPRAFMAVGALPLNANGKVDRGALARDGSAVALRADQSGPAAGPAPASTLERLIADAWAHVLGDRPGVEENFFEAGGNSLLLIRLRARLNADLHRKIATVALFNNPTIREQARFLAAAAEPAVPAAAGPAVAGPAVAGPATIGEAAEPGERMQGRRALQERARRRGEG